MKDEKLIRFNVFRKLCLSNSEDALRSAEILLDKKVNHIVFHLSVLAMEEIGKIFIGWYQLTSEEKWGKEKHNIPLDDHIKKLFWAIWGPTLGKEKITKEHLDEINNMASNLHAKRLDGLYTDLLDEQASSTKISDDEAKELVQFVRSRLELAKIEGEVKEEIEINEDMNWFIQATDNSVRRIFIFGNEAQEKLAELGDATQWISWLRKYYEKEEADLNLLMEEELKRKEFVEQKYKDKWKMKLKIISPSHSIRANIFNSFNQRYKFISLSKGGDNHTLIIEMIFGQNITAINLWQHGWFASKLFVAALNVSTNGIFYWNINVDSDKYYERIQDLESDKQLSVKLENGFKLDWKSRGLVLTEEHLHLAFIVFDYFSSFLGKDEFKPIDEYISGLGMLAKIDIHLRFEEEVFKLFYNSLKNALVNNEDYDSIKDIKDFAYEQINKIITDREEFYLIMSLGEQLQEKQKQLPKAISLTEVIAIKQYCGVYLMTLAARRLYNDKNLRLTLIQS